MSAELEAARHELREALHSARQALARVRAEGGPPTREEDADTRKDAGLARLPGASGVTEVAALARARLDLRPERAASGRLSSRVGRNAS